ncbi:MAG: flagellar assembly peptidoglycan hydrolase FlgJ [Kangiellaceae bacterium]|nr:flagellar assembly peptidoglycan hydrolase FlgJ [Kangiellaceae bacterium]
MDSVAQKFVSQSSIYSDLQSLDGIRKQAQTDQRSAIKAAAKEFEAFFMNMMLKSMRQASEVIGDDSMFSSQQEKMFIGMLDEQMSVELSQKGNLGIADLLTRDLLGDSNPVNSTTSGNLFSQTIKARNNDVHQASNVPQKVNSEPKPVPEVVSSSLNELIKTPAEKRLGQGIAEKKSLFDSAKNFISELLPAAKRFAEKLGVEPELLVAQAALETGWGKYIMHNKAGQPSYNLFGIKGGTNWNGNTVKIDTLEVEKGSFVKKKDDFRMYDSFENSFSDYVDFIKNSPRYQSALTKVSDAKGYLESLQESGYATDPEYANKILRIFEQDIKPNEYFK